MKTTARNSIALIFLSLVLAVASYYYLHRAILRAEEKQSDPSYKLIKLTAKKLPVRVRLATAPKEGYKLLEDRVVAKPSEVLVIGPEALLEEAEMAETALLDVSESIDTVKKKIPLESVAGIPLTGEPYTVEVLVPIEPVKIEPASNA